MAEDIMERLVAALDGRYAIDRQIGQGGMATVYLATDLKHQRQVAIKVLRPELSASLGTERFLREIELAAKLQHPHIVPVYDSGSADGVLYYVMPFVAGESLRDLMRRQGRVPLARAAEIIREVASGLAYAHAQGIVHRDIKPENIMLSGGHAVVADFGIARAVDASRGDSHLTGVGMAIGTPAYMSPEQATADQVDARSDQYALACVFYELVSGTQAFSGPTRQAMLTSMLTGPRPRLSAVVDGVPAAVDGATQRALATDPEQRYPSITDFALAVAEESSGEAAATRESRRWKRRALVLPAVAALLAAAAVLFLREPPRRVVSGAESMAIVPFATTGAGLEGIGEGMVDLLGGSLSGVGDIETIEPRRVIREWRQRVHDGPGDLDDALAVARSTDASSVLTGSIVTTGGTARLSAQLYDLNGAELSRASVDGPADSVLALSNALALALLRDMWRSREPLPSANASGIRSSSMPAIRAYLRGERYHRRGLWDSAQVAFEDAVAHDSTFALAWYRLANTLGWKGAYQGAQARQASALAVRYSDSLPPRLRSLLYASDLFNRADNAAIDSAMAYTRLHPSDADGWYLLGEAQYHARSYRPMAPEPLRLPFDRVLSIDSSLTQAAIHPLELAVAARDTALMRHYAAVFRAADADAELDRVTLARAALAGSDSAIAALFGDAIGSGVAFAALMARFDDPDVTGDAIAAATRVITERGRALPNGAQLVALEPTLDAALGRLDSARAYFTAHRINAPDLQGYLNVLPALAGFQTARGLAQLDSAMTASQQRNQYLATWRGVVKLNRGDYAGARTIVATMLASPDTVQVEIRGALTVIDGIAMVAQADTAGGLTRAQAGMDLIGSSLAFNAFTAPVQLRYALMQLGIPAQREAGFMRLRWGFPNWTEVYPIRERYLAEAFEGRGQPDSARAHYQRFIALWNGADSAYQPLATSVREAVARLSAEVPGRGALEEATHE